MRTHAFFYSAMSAVLLLGGFQVAQANDKAGGLPASVRSAKTIFVENQTPDAKFENFACTELTKWGRFQVVDGAQKADVILRLSNGNHVRPVSGEELDARMGAKAPAEDAVPAGYIRIALVDPKNGGVLWSDKKKSNGGQPPRGMLENLRSAIEQLEKSHAAK